MIQINYVQSSFNLLDNSTCVQQQTVFVWTNSVQWGTHVHADVVSHVNFNRTSSLWAGRFKRCPTASHHDNYRLWLKIITSQCHSMSQTNYRHYCEGWMPCWVCSRVLGWFKEGADIVPPSSFHSPASLSGSPGPLSCRWNPSLMTSWPPNRPSRTSQHLTWALLIDAWMASPPGKDFQPQMSPFVAANYWCDSKSVLFSENKLLGIATTVFTRKSGNSSHWSKSSSFSVSNSTAAATKLLTFAHVNLPAAVFYCLHSDILEGSFHPTGELRSWRQSLDNFTFGSLSRGGYN